MGRSNPHIILGCALTALMARVECPTRLDQKQLDLVLGVGLVFDTLWDYEHLPRRYLDRTVSKINPEHAVDHDERLIRFLVVVPNKIALEPHKFELVVVHLGYDLRLPLLVDQPEFFGKIDYFIAHFRYLTLAVYLQ